MCVYDGCKNWTGFNFEGLNAKYCSVHKLPSMVNVISRLCFHEGCKKRPFFNYEGLKLMYCSAHKENGMINLISKNNFYNIKNKYY